MGNCFSHSITVNRHSSHESEPSDADIDDLHLPMPPRTPLDSQTPAPDDNIALKLQHIIEGIYDAVTKAQTNVQVNNLHQLFWMFPEENGRHVPRMLPLEVTPGQVIQVPIFTLINHKNLCIHELNIKTKLDIEMREHPNVTDAVRSIHHHNYQVNIIPGKRDTTIEMSMRVEEPTEAYHRILGILEKQIGLL